MDAVSAAIVSCFSVKASMDRLIKRFEFLSTKTLCSMYRGQQHLLVYAFINMSGRL